MNSSSIRILCAAMLVAASSAAQARPAPSPTRGQLLYDTHCIECHTRQMHWRDGQTARDWATLKAEVVRWQAAARLGWDEADVVEVTRYLNDTIYHFPPTQRNARTRITREHGAAR